VRKTFHARPYWPSLFWLLFVFFCFAAETFFAGFFAPFLGYLLCCFLFRRFLFWRRSLRLSLLAAFLLAGPSCFPVVPDFLADFFSARCSRSYRRLFALRLAGLLFLERPPRPVASRLLAARKFPAQQRWPHHPQSVGTGATGAPVLAPAPSIRQRLRVARDTSGYSGSSPTSAGSSTTARIWCRGFRRHGNAGAPRQPETHLTARRHWSPSHSM